MKKIAFIGILLLASVTWSQVDVTLKINHFLGTETFALDAVAQNNLGQDFKATRLEYYISKFSIVHDGGTITDVPLEVIDLVRPGEEASTSISLGSFDVTSVELIRFHIGVYEPINNDDPTLWPAEHPLAPQSPSMHWGWAAGYRFLAYEGVGGADFSQIFQLHGLGNSNYFKTESEVDVETVDGGLVLNIDADYTEGLRDIDVAAGTISHGESGAAKKALENFRDYVFGTFTAGVEEKLPNFEWSIYPNPSPQKTVNVQFGEVNGDFAIQITNPLGQVINTIQVTDKSITELELPESGIYMVSVIKSEKIIATERVVIQ